jgi:hypothetical protein
MVELLEDVARHDPSMVGCPSADNRVELPDDDINWLSTMCRPDLSEFPSYRFDRFFAWFDQQFVPRRPIGDFVVTNVPS